ncbi:membrane hypothetical protein [Bradyrhizobium sp. STM 3843]|uniref:hypothetical protein n=1 Tax=Bradyrhizobium sp. STM 3843 TaxID=551947 RepID=UPI00024035FD|nr:hypothetical protein [Bradyrhizobium sp. STM 3843]CCE12015.1 membrane hypothetical protein [Bradyrhizobium sp. STM 3843]
MIDRRTALICGTLIALMLAGAMFWFIVPNDWIVQAVQPRASLPSLFIFPACSAFVVGVLYGHGRGERTDSARNEPWRKWGATVSMSYCIVLLLAQALVIITRLDLGIHLELRAIYRALFVAVGIIFLLGVNQLPKLPYFERRVAPGGNLGPVYGPRFMRIQSRLMFVFGIALIAYWLALPPHPGWHPTFYALVATICLFAQAIAWRRHLSRKWNLQQPGSRGPTPGTPG